MKKLAVLIPIVAVLTGFLLPAAPASALVALPCDPKGVPTADGWNAGQIGPSLTGRMRGALTAYRISCARIVTETVRSQGLPMRAAELAITTIIVEATMDNLIGGDIPAVGKFE